jgi:hypothetical protein
MLIFLWFLGIDSIIVHFFQDFLDQIRLRERRAVVLNLDSLQGEESD